MNVRAHILQSHGRNKDPNKFVRMALLRQRKLEKQRAARLKEKRDKIEARGKRGSVHVAEEGEGEREKEEEEAQEGGEDKVEADEMEEEEPERDEEESDEEGIEGDRKRLKKRRADESHVTDGGGRGGSGGGGSSSIGGRGGGRGGGTYRGREVSRYDGFGRQTEGGPTKILQRWGKIRSRSMPETLPDDFFKFHGRNKIITFQKPSLGKFHWHCPL